MGGTGGMERLGLRGLRGLRGEWIGMGKRGGSGERNREG